MASSREGNAEKEAVGSDVLTAHLLSSLESMPDGFILLDRDWRFLYLNAQAEKILRRTREGLLGRNMWAEFPDAVGSIAEREYSRVMREGGTTTFEIDYAPLNARLEVRAHATQTGGLGLFVRDVTDRFATEERARLLQAAVSQLDDIVMITEAAAPGEDRASALMYVNEAFERLTGFTRAEAETLPNKFLRGRMTDMSVLEPMIRELRTGKVVRGELAFLTKDGSTLCVDMQIAPFRAPSGEATHMVVVSRDITGRKRAESELRESNERFRLIAQATADVVWDWNLTDNTIWWSDGIRSRFGHVHGGSAPVQEAWFAHIHPDDLDRVVAGAEAVIKSGGESWSAEYRFMHADGLAAQVMDRGFVIRDEGGVALRMVGSMLDVTEQRELEARLRQSQRLEAVGQLTGGIAHDFNNLLTVILSNAELLEKRLAHDERSRMLAEMSRMAAERGAELTNRLLAFSRSQALDPKPTDVATLVRNMKGLLGRALGEQISVEVSAEPDLWSALIDTLQLETAILNLCINARDAMPDGGVVRIDMANTSSEGRDWVLVCVSDSGIGMDAATVARAFEPFFTTKDVGKGSGLGLSMVYGFVTQSKGRVEIESAPGEGARVKLYLPRGPQIAQQAQPVADPAAATGSERVLLVEDDDLVRVQVSTELETLGYRVVTARSGAEALEVLQTAGPFDLLFTDVVMPGGMNGRELAEAAHRIAPDLPVLYTSGNPDIILSEEGRIASGTLLLRKPYRRRELALKLLEALGAR
jgi:PAS domain S-box-containing protein